MKKPGIGNRESGIVRLTLLTIAHCLFPIAVVLAWLSVPLPDAMLAPPKEPGVTILDRHGLLLRTTRSADGSLAQWSPLEAMDPQLLQAFVAMEDRRFYGHGGVDLRAAARAAMHNVQAGQVVSGASTITMQLARLLRPSNRGWTGKISQALLALRLERQLSKQHILEQYLNRVPLGQGTIGVSAAATLYFDASANGLSLAQAAQLAGIAAAPSSGNPFASPERAAIRRATALRRMGAQGYITGDQAERAALEPMIHARSRAPFLAPHFTARLLQWAEDANQQAGGTWTTSLDLALQAELEAEVRHTVTLLKDREVRHAAAVVLDNHTGEILAWVGSPDFWADSAGQVDMVFSPRQPGSTLKPFLYALAFERGYTAASVLPDVARTFATPTGPYQPRNYDRRFHGPVLMREALASSFNVPAVELTERLSASALLRTLQAAGFQSLDRSAEHYGLGLSLGNGDVTLLELANGYRALANGGTWSPWRTSAADAGPAGHQLPAISHRRIERRVTSRGAAALVLDVLSDPVARIAGFGLETPFDFPFPVAVKTGTSRHFTDNWAVGVTGNLTVAVWVGNFSGRPMRRIGGITGAGPLLHRALLSAARRYDPGVLPSPGDAGLVRATVCRVSGLQPGEHCPVADEWFLPGTFPHRNCDWHRDGHTNWPAEYAEWASQRSNAGTPVATGGSSDDFRILSPQTGDQYQVPPGVEARYATIALHADAAACRAIVA